MSDERSTPEVPPRERLRSFLRRELKRDPSLDLSTLTGRLNEWRELGHHHAGHRLWPGPFTEAGAARVLRGGGIKLSTALRRELDASGRSRSHPDLELEMRQLYRERAEAREAHRRLMLSVVSDVSSELTATAVDDRWVISLREQVVAEVDGHRMRAFPETVWLPLRFDRSDHLEDIRRVVGRSVELRLAAEALADAAAARTERLRAQIEALSGLGVPARLRNGSVVVTGVGAVPELAEGESAKRCARTFIERQTARDASQIASRLEQVLATKRVGAQVVTTARGIEVRDGKIVLAVVDRFGFEVDCRRRSGDVIGEPGVLRKLGSSLRATETEREEVRRRSDGVKRNRQGRPLLPPPPQLLADRRIPLVAPQAQTAASQRQTPAEPDPIVQVLTRFPAGLSAVAESGAMRASALLRAERRLVPAVSVEVACEHGVFDFAPVPKNREPLEAPFEYVGPGGGLSGALRLNRRADPLSLRLTGDPSASVVAVAWAAALIIYAQLTCGEAPAPHTRRSEQRVPRSTGVGRAAQPGRPYRGPGPGSPRQAREGSAAPSLARAIEEIRAVSGHLRRLRAGHSSSLGALQAAASVGVRVPSGYTWVSPHHRGDHLVRVRLPAGAVW